MYAYMLVIPYDTIPLRGHLVASNMRHPAGNEFISDTEVPRIEKDSV